MNIRRRRNKNDISTRRLSFSKSISDTSNTSIKSKRSPAVKSKNVQNLRRSRQSSILEASRDNAIVPQIQNEPEFNIRDLLGKRWTVYRASPLNNFKPGKLKIYGKKLSEELCSISNRFNEEDAYTLKASFAVSNDINPRNNGVHAIQVKVITEKNRNNYLGYFISWIEQTADENLLSLPILLVQGRKQTQTSVHQTLCKFFDCDIQPVHFSLKLLVMLFAKYLEAFKEEIPDTSVLSLQYRIPNYPTKDSITVTLSLADTVTVFLVLLNQGGEDVDSALFRMQLYDKILCHILNIYRIDLIPAKLFKVVFPDAVVTADGEIKWSTKEMAMLGLSMLQKLIPLD